MKELNKMCQMSQINIPISDITKSITVQVCVTGREVWAVKLWAGKALITLAARIMGMNVEIEIKD